MEINMGVKTPEMAAEELGITMGDIIRGVAPFVVLILVGLGLFAVFPQLILWLPSLMIQR